MAHVYVIERLEAAKWIPARNENQAPIWFMSKREADQYCALMGEGYRTTKVVD